MCVHVHVEYIHTLQVKTHTAGEAKDRHNYGYFKHSPGNMASTLQDAN